MCTIYNRNCVIILSVIVTFYKVVYETVHTYYLSKIVFSLSKEPEAFGRISLESLSMGIPVIAYSHGGVKEQMLEILPEGLIAVENINLVASLANKWIKKGPEINKTHSFMLKNMLEKTFLVYKQAIKDKCQK